MPKKRTYQNVFLRMPQPRFGVEQTVDAGRQTGRRRRRCSRRCLSLLCLINATNSSSLMNSFLAFFFCCCLFSKIKFKKINKKCKEKISNSAREIERKSMCVGKRASLLCWVFITDNCSWRGGQLTRAHFVSGRDSLNLTSARIYRSNLVPDAYFYFSLEKRWGGMMRRRPMGFVERLMCVSGGTRPGTSKTSLHNNNNKNKGAREGTPKNKLYIYITARPSSTVPSALVSVVAFISCLFYFCFFCFYFL